MIRISQPLPSIPHGLAALPAPLVRRDTPWEEALVRHRAKLWELNGTLHCSIIGTCLTASELRRLMAKLAQRDVAHLSDHDLHAEAVGLSGYSNACSKLLQKTLEQRHQTAIKRFAAARGEAAVMDKWGEARRAGDIPGAYWAVLTHPDAGHAGMRQAFGDVHMLSHLVGAANRADIRRLAALEADNASLLAKVERQQARMHEAITARDATIHCLGTLAAAQVKADPDSGADDTVAALHALVADLRGRLTAETGRRERLDQRLADCSKAGQLADQRAREAEAACQALTRELAALEAHQDGAAAPTPPAALPAERVLYVGGRTGCVEHIRDALANANGELLCHDGGKHDHPSLLPGLISRASLVVFPVDCVSHDAALTVKRLCRQAGKRWLPLRSAGIGSFLAAVGETCCAPGAEPCGAECRRRVSAP